uniref:G-protein coupled receptors family 1 profile domain-containing protein n=1 Tax=Acrobeloides nanus TaxID=290746 RepID=A0A914E989_9BILA
MTRSLRIIAIRYHKNRQSIRNRNREHDRAKISVLLLITTITFVVCTLPASLLSLYIDYTPHGIGLQIFRALANCLQVSHYSPNFYLYTIYSNEYRNAFLALFGCRKSKSIQATTGDSPTMKISSNLTGRVVRSIRYNRCCSMKKADTITEI